MPLLDDLLSQDASRILSACGLMLRLRDEDQLKHLSQFIPQIQKATKDIKLGGALCPNTYHVEFALKKLKHIKNNAGCLCALYPDNMFFNPDQENKDGYIRITDTVTIENKWVDYYLCECTKCPSTFKVEERMGHYMWWGWKKIQE